MDKEDEGCVFDPWGNEVGLDGELSEGDRLYTRGGRGTPGCLSELV